VSLLVLAVVVAGVAVYLPLRSSRPGAVRIVAYRGPMPRFTVPSGYHITFDVTVRGRRHTEELFIHRPFASYEEAISGGKPYLVTAMRLGEQVFRANAGTATLIHTALSPSRRDIRLDAVARYAAKANRLRLIGRARVRGETCFVFRSAAALSSGPLAPIPKRSFVDSCIDSRGLLVYERTTSDGKVVSERRATGIALGGSSPGYSLQGDAIPTNKGGGAMRALTMDSRLSSGPFWDIAKPPAGFRHTGRYVVIPSQPQAYADTSAFSMNAAGLPGSLVVSIDDVYVRGSDALVIEQGSTVNDAKFTAPLGGEDIDLGEVLGHGQLLASASASEVVAEPHDGTRFVRVIGTLPPDELIAIARQMTLQPPGTMRRAS
jgi:hypothetical protein